MSEHDQAAKITEDWTHPRWKGIDRAYTAKDVKRLAGSFPIEYTLAQRGARRLWDLLNGEDYVAALGAMTGNQAIQQVQAGLQAIYVSGWQVAGDANEAGEIYPDQSLYPAEQRAHAGAADQQRPAPRRPDPARRRRPTAPTGSSPSWPTPRPASAATSTPSS